MLIKSLIQSHWSRHQQLVTQPQLSRLMSYGHRGLQLSQNNSLQLDLVMNNSYQLWCRFPAAKQTRQVFCWVVSGQFITLTLITNQYFFYYRKLNNYSSLDSFRGVGPVGRESFCPSVSKSSYIWLPAATDISQPGNPNVHHNDIIKWSNNH